RDHCAFAIRTNRRSDHGQWSRKARAAGNHRRKSPKLSVLTKTALSREASGRHRPKAIKSRSKRKIIGNTMGATCFKDSRFSRNTLELTNCSMRILRLLDMVDDFPTSGKETIALA